MSENSVNSKPSGEIPVLFVDDERALRMVADRLLMRLGYQPHVAENGIEALGLFKAQPDLFKVIVTDQNMPEMLGLELAAEVRKINPRIPIILVTGFADTADLEAGHALGITEIINKPYSTEILAAAIKKMLART